jgi:hypothetical protein
MFDIKKSSLIWDVQLFENLKITKQKSEPSFDDVFIVEGFITHIFKRKLAPNLFFLRIEFEWLPPLVLDNIQFSAGGYSFKDVKPFDCVSVVFFFSGQHYVCRVINKWVYLNFFNQILSFIVTKKGLNATMRKIVKKKVDFKNWFKKVKFCDLILKNLIKRKDFMEASLLQYKTILYCNNNNNNVQIVYNFFFKSYKKNFFKTINCVHYYLLYKRLLLKKVRWKWKVYKRAIKSFRIFFFKKKKSKKFIKYRKSRYRLRKPKYKTVIYKLRHLYNTRKRKKLRKLFFKNFFYFSSNKMCKRQIKKNKFLCAIARSKKFKYSLKTSLNVFFKSRLSKKKIYIISKVISSQTKVDLFISFKKISSYKKKKIKKRSKPRSKYLFKIIKSKKSKNFRIFGNYKKLKYPISQLGLCVSKFTSKRYTFKLLHFLNKKWRYKKHRSFLKRKKYRLRWREKLKKRYGKKYRKKKFYPSFWKKYKLTSKHVSVFVKRLKKLYNLKLNNKKVFAALFFKDYIYNRKKKKEYIIKRKQYQYKTNNFFLRTKFIPNLTKDYNNYMFMFENIFKLKLIWFMCVLWNTSYYLLFNLKYFYKFDNLYSVLFYTLVNKNLYSESVIFDIILQNKDNFSFFFVCEKYPDILNKYE